MGKGKQPLHLDKKVARKNGIGVSWYHSRQVVTWDYPRIHESKLVQF